MRATEGLLVRWQNGQSHFPFSQWLTIAIAVLMVLSSGGLLLAQDVIDPVVNRQPGHAPLRAATCNWPCKRCSARGKPIKSPTNQYGSVIDIMQNRRPHILF